MGYLNENSLKLQVSQASEMPSQSNVLRPEVGIHALVPEQSTGLFWGLLQSGPQGIIICSVVLEGQLSLAGQ